jgi:hypothetical protein
LAAALLIIPTMFCGLINRTSLSWTFRYAYAYAVLVAVSRRLPMKNLSTVATGGCQSYECLGVQLVLGLVVLL